jgi:hypothetical protein
MLSRFFAKVNARGPTQPHMPTPCHVWTAYRLPYGYGVFTISRATKLAHRVAWEIANGKPVSKGKLVLHHCDNPSCVRPDHLHIGSQVENMREMRARGRGKDVPCPGEQHGRAKLTEPLVLYIRASKESTAAIARELGVSRSAISHVRKRRTWKHIGEN